MSLWLKDLSPDEDRKLAILEPVERTIGKVRKICIMYILGQRGDGPGRGTYPGLKFLSG